MEYVLKTDAVCKITGILKALNGLSMSVPKGAIYGFVGKNGAGKTTLIRIICGLPKASAGEYTLYGREKHGQGYCKITQQNGRCSGNTVYLS